MGCCKQEEDTGLEDDHVPEPSTKTNKVEFVEDEGCLNFCSRRRNIIIIILMLVGVASGIGVGVVLRNTPPFNRPKLHPIYMMYLNFPAELLIRVMTMLSVPLIVASLVAGLSSLEPKSSAKLGVRALVLYLGTTALAVGEGLIFVYVIRPDNKVKAIVKVTGSDLFPPQPYNSIHATLDLFRNIFPDSLVGTCFQTVSTDFVNKTINFDEENLVNDTHLPTNMTFVDLYLKPQPGINTLGLVVISVTFAIALSVIQQDGFLLVQCFNAVHRIVLKILNIVIWFYPVGIFFMVTVAVVSIDNPAEHFRAMPYFLITCSAAMLTHALLVMPLLLVAITRTNPFVLIKYCFRAILTSFATNNSALSLPVTMDCLRKAGINRHVVQFMCPLGVAINMDGLAMYEATSVVYLAAIRGIPPSPLQVFIIGFTTVAVSLGAPAIGGGLVLHAILFQIVGLPLQDIAIILPFEWLMGRLSRTISVWSDCLGAAIVNHTMQDNLHSVEYTLVQTSSVNFRHNDSNSHQVNSTYRKSYTLTMENESGDIMKVSKV